MKKVIKLSTIVGGPPPGGGGQGVIAP